MEAPKLLFCIGGVSLFQFWTWLGQLNRSLTWHPYTRMVYSIKGMLGLISQLETQVSEFLSEEDAVLTCSHVYSVHQLDDKRKQTIIGRTCLLWTLCFVFFFLDFYLHTCWSDLPSS